MIPAPRPLAAKSTLSHAPLARRRRPSQTNAAVFRVRSAETGPESPKRFELNPRIEIFFKYNTESGSSARV